jgi:hypothetical protein
MTDESKKPEPEDGWVMPEPVFRSSKGYSPLKEKVAEEDIPTETADKIPDEADTDELPVAEEKQHVRPITPRKKKNGCLGTVAFFVGIISLSIAIILALLVYFLYFYVSEPTGVF